MNVLLLTMDFPPMKGGISRYTHKVMEILSHTYHDQVSVLAPQIREAKAFDDHQNFAIIRFNRSHSSKSDFFVLSAYLFRLLKTHPISVVLASTWFPPGAACSFVCRMFGVPYFVFAHGFDFLYTLRRKDHIETINKLLARGFLRMVLGNASGIISNSRFTRQQLIQLGISSELIYVVNPGVDASRFSPSEELRRAVREEYQLDPCKVILTVGRLRERKGQDMVIRALPKLAKKLPEVHYLVVGEGPYRDSLQILAHELSVSDRVTFTGFVPEQELSGIYNACDVFIMPSRELDDQGDIEGFGIVYLEANACGKPVIGGCSGGIGDAVVCGQTGLLVDPTSVSEITEVLEHLLTDPEKAERLGAQGRARVEDSMTWHKTVSAIRSILRRS